MNDLIILNKIKNKIHNIRGKQVMLDSDLAELYKVTTSRLNEQVKRNKERFPEDFMFQLNEVEFKHSENLMSQNAISSWGGIRKLPFAFTEQGVAMLSSVLRSKRAVEVNVKIMRAFVEMRRFLSQNMVVFQKFFEIDQKLLVHDDNFNKIFDAMEKKEFPLQGVFFEGQVFDAFVFVSKLVKKAKHRIVLLDNYVDEITLKLFSDKNKGVSVKIYSKYVDDKFLLATEKFNEQFGDLQIFKFDKSHDRFLIIDDELYHFGASLKDIGKKWFAFSKLNIDVSLILDCLL